MQYDIIQNNQQLKIDYLQKLCNCMRTVADCVICLLYVECLKENVYLSCTLDN